MNVVILSLRGVSLVTSYLGKVIGAFFGIACSFEMTAKMAWGKFNSLDHGKVND